MQVKYRAAGVVVVRRQSGGWRYLVLRAYKNWGFPKGLLEEGEAHFAAAIRETSEETAINDLAFHWGHEFRETIPYGNAKVARYYLAETKQSNLVLPVSPSLDARSYSIWILRLIPIWTYFFTCTGSIKLFLISKIHRNPLLRQYVSQCECMLAF